MEIPVRAFFIKLQTSTFEIVSRTVFVGRSPQMRKVRTETVHEFPTARTEDTLRGVLDSVNEIWAQAGIAFKIKSSSVEAVHAPDDAETVNANGFLYLVKQIPAGDAVRLFLVHKFASPDLGGQAIQGQTVCIVGDGSPPSSFAHEFGHLLNLEHEGDIRNLMNPGLSIPKPQLTTGQIKRAQGSQLFARFK